MAKPFVWGKHDCLLFLADWVLWRTGVDPAAPWRGLYDDSVGAGCIIGKAGGQIPLVHQALAGCGDRVNLGEAGDIAIVAAPEGQVGTLVISRYAGVALTLTGIAVRPFRLAPVLAAWRIAGN